MPVYRPVRKIHFRYSSMLAHKAHGNRIRHLRDVRGWTQQQLATASGYSIKTIWKAEAGRSIKRQTLTDIAHALNVEFRDIVESPAGRKAGQQQTK